MFVLNTGGFVASIYFQNAKNTFNRNRFKCYYIIYTDNIDRFGIKATTFKINNSSIVTSICPKYY